MKFNTKSDRKTKKEILNQNDDIGFVQTGYCTNGVPNLNYATQTPSAEHMLKHRKPNYKKKESGMHSNRAEELLFALKSTKIMKKSANIMANVEKKKISFKTIGVTFTGLFKPSKRIGRNGQVIFSEEEEEQQMMEHEMPQQQFQPILPNQINYLLQRQQQPQYPANIVSMVNLMQNDASGPVTTTAVRKSQPQMGVRALYTKRNTSNQDLTESQSSNPKKRERSGSVSFRKNKECCAECKNLSCSCYNKSNESSIFVKPEPVKATPFLDSMEHARRYARSSSYTNMSTINITVTNPQVELNVTPIKPHARKSCKTVKKLSVLSLNPNNPLFGNQPTHSAGSNFIAKTYSTYV